MQVFSSVPFFRILIPFVAGILPGIYMDVPVFSPFYLLGIFLLISAVFLFSKRELLKILLLGLMDLFLFVYGLMLVTQCTQIRGDLFYGTSLLSGKTASFMAVVDDLPVEKERSFKLSLKILEIKNGADYNTAEGNVIAYVRKSQKTKQLKAGDVLLIKSLLQAVPGPMNPCEFNYKTYLQNRQVYHTTFVDSNAYSVLAGRNRLNQVWKAGLICKHYILKRLKNSPLSADSYAICCALLTGYDDEIDKTVMEAFSHSGTLHVLSVSGLHTGLIYLVLGFMFDLADRRKKHKLLKFVFIALFLWFFALITGFSSPVLRAVLMFNLLGIGKIYFRNDAGNQMNILLVSAFFLLSYNPFYITDVGFQLSYFALAGLIYFQAGISAMWQPQNYVLNLTWQSIAASIAATLSTLPLTLLYFKQFPAWFFVCNLVVVPATFAILLLAVFAVLQLNFAAVLINYSIKFLIVFINFFNSESYGFVDMISFDLIDALFLSAFIVLLSLTLRLRSYRLAISSLMTLIFWQILALLTSIQQKQKELFTFYQIKNKSIYALKDKDRVYLRGKEIRDYNFHVKPHFISFNASLVITCEFNYFEKGPYKLLVLDRPGLWPDPLPQGINTLVLCNNFRLNAEDLLRFTALKTLVMGSSNNSLTIRKTEELSRKFGLNFYNTYQHGAYLLALDD